METNRLAWTLLLLFPSTAAFKLHAQPTEADRKLLADIRAQAEKGDAESQLDLGEVFYFGGLGVAKDEVEAVKWFRKAADQNYAAAQYSVGVCHAKGDGVAKNDAEAVKVFRKAAEQNYAPAQYNLGACYGKGEGVAEDDVEAEKWFHQAS